MNFDEFMEIINVLGNPDVYNKKVAELKAYQKSIQDNMDATINIARLKELLANAAITVFQANDLKVKAALEAAKTVADSTVVFNDRYAKLAEKELAATNAVAKYNELFSQQTSREASYREQEKTLATQAKNIAAQQATMASQQVELTERLTKLRSVMG